MVPAAPSNSAAASTIAGHGATLQRSTAPGTPQFAIIQVDSGGLTVSDLNFRNGVPAEDHNASLVEAYHRLLMHPDPAVHTKAARDWCDWEMAIVAVQPNHTPHPRYEQEEFRLAFARIVLHAPPWILIDEVLDSLEDEARQAVFDIFTKDLQHTGIIHIGRAEAHDHLFSRVLHLVKDPTLRRLRTAAPPLTA